MKSFSIEDGFEERIFHAIPAEFRKIGPVKGKDGVCRLKDVSRWSELNPEDLPLIPLKKFVLPPRDELWGLTEERYEQPPAPPPVALLGIPPCDLYALDYLDRVFEEDVLYRCLRDRLLVVGAGCTPSERCFCPPRPEPPPFDLFLGEGRLWVGSAKGEALLGNLGEGEETEGFPFPAKPCRGGGPPLPENLEDVFRDAAGRAIWLEVGGRCLSCGGCSAVCPTCYCYDVVDEASVNSGVRRVREWDNCFFRSHALVAGGHNFRPDRGARLRFRFEHKFLGFGPLRGVSSCVGCGRCGRACPVKIDVAEVLSTLTTGEGS
jgi:sulfhydrogenase subunit beta (sulfur reductase)